MLTVAPTGSTNLVMRRSTPRPSSRQRKVMGSVAELGERTQGLRAGDGGKGLEQRWDKEGLPSRTLGGHMGAIARSGWQGSNISKADNCTGNQEHTAMWSS